MAPTKKPPLKPKPKIMLPRNRVPPPGNNQSPASQPGPSRNVLPGAASRVSQPGAGPSCAVTPASASQPGPSRAVAPASTPRTGPSREVAPASAPRTGTSRAVAPTSAPRTGPSRNVVPGAMLEQPGPPRVSYTPGLPRSLIPGPSTAGRGGSRLYASASPSPHRLPVFPAVPININGVAAAGAEVEPISPIEPVRPGIEDDTIPLNSTALDDSIMDTAEPMEQVAGSSKRTRYPRKQNSPQKGNRSTNKALYEIKKYQKGGDLLIPKASFRRLVWSCRRGTDFRWAKDAYEALQEACEDYLVHTFMKAQACAFHAKRITVQPVDMLLAERLADF